MKDAVLVNEGTIAVSSTIPVAETEIFNYNVLIERCMGNIGLANRLIDKCRTYLPQEFKELEKAFADKDAQQVALLAHRLKGATATILAQGMKRAAEEIEQCGRGGRLVDIPPQIERLHQEWERFEKVSRSFIQPADSRDRGTPDIA
jgi:HPt (histidine-containing phosphotransfer) domain-containing protein